jgi:uncharacterized protein YjbJ (UPF0337 family)
MQNAATLTRLRSATPFARRNTSVLVARRNESDEEGAVSMAERDSGPEAGIKGAVEGVKGKAKEVAGIVTGNDKLEREGEAQQDKADAQRDVAQKEAEADAARAQAAAHEAEQRSQQQ